LHGEVLSPNSRVIDGVVQFDYAIERIPGLLFVLKDVHQQSGDGNRRDGRKAGEDEELTPVPGGPLGMGFSHMTYLMSLSCINRSHVSHGCVAP
jgi:hypothetical protein